MMRDFYGVYGQGFPGKRFEVLANSFISFRNMISEPDFKCQAANGTLQVGSLC